MKIPAFPLPLGSVVLLEDGEKEVMIYGRAQVASVNNKEYDYVACLFPEGNISEEYTYLFNHEDIDTLLFTGYVNGDEKLFVKENLTKSVAEQETK